MRTFTAPDGSRWGIEIRSPGSTNAMVVFLNAGGREAHGDRYGWYIARGPEARSVTGRLKPDDVLKALTDDHLLKLYKRSFPLGTGDSQDAAATAATYPAVGSGKN
jgi:hypothetical protein